MPICNRYAIVHRPTAVPFDRGQRRSHGLRGVAKMRVEFIGGAPVLGIGTIAPALKYRDLIVEFAATQRILNEMHVGACPHNDVIEPGVLRYFLDRKCTAIG